MKRRFPITAVAVLAVSASMHCAPTSELGTDDAAHTANQASQRSSELAWANVDYATFKAYASDGLSTVGEALPDDDPIAVRLQAWVDRIDAIVDEEMRAAGETRVAPKPRVKVLRTQEQNAWVSSMPVCFPKPVVHESGSELLSPTSCVKPSNWATVSEEEYLAALAHGTPDCTFEADGTRIVAHGDGCSMLQPIYATAPFVFYTTAYAGTERFERAMVNTLAHELGHYYRGHASTVLLPEAFWYEQSATPTAGRPIPVSDSPTLEEAASRFGVRSDDASTAEIVRVPDQQLSAHLTLTVARTIADLLPAVKADTPEGFACEAAMPFVEGRWRSAFFPGARPNAEARASYLQFERALLACAGSIRVGDDFGANTVPAGRYTSKFAPSPGATLGAQLAGTSEGFGMLEREARAWESSLSSRRLGRYTWEQEADEISVELTAKLGIDPKRTVDEILELVRDFYAKDPAGWSTINAIDFETCERLYAADWQTTKPDGTREPAYVPLGDLLEPHHGECYRIYNMSREIAAHRYVTAAPSGPVLDETLWATLREHAREETARAAAPTPGFVPAPGQLAGQAPRALVRRIIDTR